MGKNWRTKNNCFWCGKKLCDSSRTRDHLLCRYIRRHIYPEGRSVAACANCNRARGAISCLFEKAHRLKTGAWGDWLDNPPTKETLIISAQYLLSRIDVGRFEKKVRAEVSGAVKRICLMEIEEVLALVESGNETVAEAVRRYTASPS